MPIYLVGESIGKKEVSMTVNGVNGTNDNARIQAQRDNDARAAQAAQRQAEDNQRAAQQQQQQQEQKSGVNLQA